MEQAGAEYYLVTLTEFFYPTDFHSPHKGQKILAVTPGMRDKIFAHGTGNYNARFWARTEVGKDDAETVGSIAMVPTRLWSPQGQGEIFSAGTVYWFLGLK